MSTLLAAAALITFAGARALPIDHVPAVAVTQIDGNDYVGRVSIAPAGANPWQGPYRLGHYVEADGVYALRDQIPIESASTGGVTYDFVTAFDPSVAEFAGKTWVAFECSVLVLRPGAPAEALIGSSHACTGRLERAGHGFKVVDAAPVVQGHDFVDDAFEVSASVPKLLAFDGELYLYWTACTIDGTIAQFTTVRTRGARVRVEDGRYLRFPDLGDAERIGTTDPRAVDVMNPLPGDPNSDLTADIFALKGFQRADGKKVIVATAAVGGGTYPHDQPEGTYRIVFATSFAPLAPGGFDRFRLDNGLTVAPGEYAQIVGAQGRYALRVAFRTQPSLPGGFTEYPIVGLDQVLNPRDDAREVIGRLVAAVPGKDAAGWAAAAARRVAAQPHTLPAEMASYLAGPALAQQAVVRMYQMAYERRPSAWELRESLAVVAARGYGAAFRAVMARPEFTARPSAVTAPMLTGGWIDRDLMSWLFSLFGGRLPSQAEYHYLTGTEWRGLALRVATYFEHARGRSAAFNAAARGDEPHVVYREMLRQYVARLAPGYEPAWVERTAIALRDGRVRFDVAIAQLAYADAFLGVLVQHVYQVALHRDAQAADLAAWRPYLRANGYFAFWQQVTGSAEFALANRDPNPQLTDPVWQRDNFVHLVFVLFAGGPPADAASLGYYQQRLAVAGGTLAGLAAVVGEIAAQRQLPTFRVADTP